MAFRLTSPAFGDRGSIPVRHTCDGKDLPPALAWTDPPAGTSAFALVVDDPDAPSGTFTHWMVWNLPTSMRELPASPSADPGVSGTNDFGRRGYAGPCPPAGHGRHHYRFALHALASGLTLDAGARRADLDRALEGRVLATAVLTGLYERRR